MPQVQARAADRIDEMIHHPSVTLALVGTTRPGVSQYPPALVRSCTRRPSTTVLYANGRME